MHIHIAFQSWSSRFEDHQSVNDIQCYECKLHHIWKNIDKERSPKEHRVMEMFLACVVVMAVQHCKLTKNH